MRGFKGLKDDLCFYYEEFQSLRRVNTPLPPVSLERLKVSWMFIVYLLCFKEEVVDRVEINICSGWNSWEKGCLLPSEVNIFLSILYLLVLFYM